MNHSLDNQTRNAGGGQAKTAAEPAVVAQSCVFDFLVAVAHPVPGIVPLLSHDFLETAADEKLHGVKARLIHVGKDRVHHACRHVVRPQARVAVAQRGINDADLFRLYPLVFHHLADHQALVAEPGRNGQGFAAQVAQARRS